MPKNKAFFFRIRGVETSVLKSKLVESDQVSFSLLSTNFKITTHIYTLSLPSDIDLDDEDDEELRIRRPQLVVIRNNLKYFF